MRQVVGWSGVALLLAGLSLAGCSGGSGGEGGSTGGSSTSSGGTGGAPLPECSALNGNVFVVQNTLFKTGEEDTKNFDGTVSGTVTEVGMTEGDPKEAYVVFEDADGVSWTASYGVGWTASSPGEVAKPLSLTVGQELSATRHYEPYDIEPATSSLTLRGGGALTLYTLDQNRGKRYLPDELALADGDILCETQPGSDGGCGKRVYDLIATVGAAEAHFTPGQTATVGDLEIHVGQWHASLDGGGCDAGDSRQMFVVPAL